MHSLIDMQAGYQTNNVVFEKRPVSLKPILKVQDKKGFYEIKHAKGIKGEILQNLHELIFYINGSRYGSNEYFKQHIFPFSDCPDLDSSKIQSFIRNSRNIFLSNINLVGNPFLYPDFEKCLNHIADFSIQCTVHVMIQDFLDNMQKMKEINYPDKMQFKILVDHVFDISQLQDISVPFSIMVFVFSEESYSQIFNFFESFSTDHNVQIVPLYNGKNLDFFESNVFVEQEDLENIDLTKDEIFIRQALNIGDFGKLTVMPDANIYANVNDSLLGSIDDSPYSIVYKEFTEGKSWFRLRDEEPCNNCVYQWLCSSPSNYEIAIGRPNLCHVKP
jgi:pseudo-rSAM protein